MKLSLALIVKADDKTARQLDTCLKSCADIFDEICLTITGENEACEEVAKRYNAKVSHFDWINDFAAARNYNFSQVTGDWVMWLDADDVLRGKENLRHNIELADSHNVTGLNVLYHYAHDKQGNVTDSHWKLQIVKNGFYTWDGAIHENLTPTKPSRDARIKDIIRVHTATEKDSEASLKRNLVILNEQIDKNPDEPRNYFYAARCLLGVEDWIGVIGVIEKYLTLSDWKAERYDALNMMGEAYTRLGKYEDALKIHTAATLELEDAPDAYIYKARNYVQQENWVDALTSLEIAETRSRDNTVLTRSALYDHDLYVLSAICYLQIGEFAKGKACAERAHKNRKSDESKEILDLATQMLRDEEVTLQYRKLGESLLDEPEKLRKLLETAPSVIINDPRILALRFAAVEPKNWENGVAIYCGNSLEEWDGNSVKNGGIGGSETAVIEIAKRMAADGKEVVVYNACNAPSEGKLIDGVLYRNYWEFNKQDNFDVLWIWRSPELVDEGVRARKIIVDMHDVSTPAVFTEERLAKIDHVFLKTNYHRSLFPNIPDEKVVIVGNGIDLSRFDINVRRSPKRVIYTSTQNRGLEQILDIWPKVLEKEPKAELHVFYGWNTFYETHKQNPAKMDWMKSMQAKMQQPGIVNHGRVSQIQLAEEMKKSAIWLYPTQFQEIHCITALEMQAAGCVPITSGFAALAETQASGIKVTGDPKDEKVQDKYVTEILQVMEAASLYKKDIEAGLEYVKQCTWDKVTSAWIETLWN